MVTFARALAGLLMLGALGACSSMPRAVEPDRAQLAALSNAKVPLQLAAGDKIRVTVFGEEKLSGDYDIDAAGFVSLPLAGTMKAAGLTKSQLEGAIARKFQGAFLKDPKITVDIAAYRPFYILGEVEKPGEYQYKSGLNVLSATALAGGPTYRASKSDLLIQKGGVGPFIRVPLSPTIPVLPGDLIRVPERYF